MEGGRGILWMLSRNCIHQTASRGARVRRKRLCCSVLQCVAVCCSILQSVVCNPGATFVAQTRVASMKRHHEAAQTTRTPSHYFVQGNEAYSYVTGLIQICLTWLTHVWHVSFMCDENQSCVTDRVWRELLAGIVRHVILDSSTCDMTHPCVSWLIYVRRESVMCDRQSVTWITCLNVSHVTHDSSIECESCHTWLIHVWHESSVCDRTHPCATWISHVWQTECDVNYSIELFCGKWPIKI